VLSSELFLFDPELSLRITLVANDTFFALSDAIECTDDLSEGDIGVELDEEVTWSVF